MSIHLESPHEMAEKIAGRAKAKRLALNLSQQTLSKTSGVPYGTLKKFEKTGQISFESLLKIALALDEFEMFDHLFTKTIDTPPPSLDMLLEEHVRKRGRK